MITAVIVMATTITNTTITINFYSTPSVLYRIAFSFILLGGGGYSPSPPAL
jgi:hypothetical protein